MPTYYKYAEREADSYINWAEVGKNMSDMLANENKVREEKKAALDAASREFGETLANAPQGESKLMNEWALQYANDAQSARLMQDKLLKSGQLKLKDYLVMRQNVTDGTTSAFNLSKEYQEEFKTKWDRMKADQSQDLEQFLMAEAEGFGNFTQTQLYINPTDGKVSVAFKEKDANGVYVMSKDPNKFTDINSLRNRIKGNFDKYDVGTNMDAYVDGLGTEINAFVQTKNSYGATGTIMEVLDYTKRENFPTDPEKVKALYAEAVKKGFKGTQDQWLSNQKNLQAAAMDFEKAETKALEAQLANPYNTSSLLTNTVNVAPNGKEYSFTWDEKVAAANPDKILLRNKPNGNPVPEFSEEQKKVALDRLRLEARMRYDKKESLTSTSQLQKQYAPQYVQQQGQDDKNLVNTATLIGTLWGGADGAAIKKATTAFRDINPNVQKVDRTPTGVVVTLKGADGKLETRNLPFYGTDGKLMSQQDFIMSAAPLLGGNADWKSAVSRGGLLKGAKFNETASEASEVERPTTQADDYTPQITQYATGNTSKNISIDAPKQTAINLNKVYNRLGFTFTGKTDGMFNQNDYIQIKGSNGVTSDWIPVDNLDNLDAINQFIIDNADQTKAAAAFPKTEKPKPDNKAPR